MRIKGTALQLPEFDACISAACAIANTDRLIVIGSQAVLAQTNAREIPKEVLMSNEVDVTTVHTTLGLSDEKWRNISAEMLGAIEFHLRVLCRDRGHWSCCTSYKLAGPG